MEKVTSLPHHFTAVDYNPFDVEREIDKIIAINESQREIWLSCLIGGTDANLAYNESISLDLKGTFSLANFKKAWHTVTARHEALRSTVSTNGLHFIVYKSLAYEFEVFDFTSQDPKIHDESISSFIKDQMTMPLDLVNGPLFRVYLHQLSEEHFLFTLVIHHIVCDGWSTGIILENLSAAYNAYQEKREPNLPTAIQLSQYAKVQHQYLESDEFQENEQFWLNQYQGDIPVLNLPIDFERGKQRSYKANRIDYTLSPSLVKQLKLAGARAGCSLVNTMLSLFEIFLARTTGQHDIVVGLPTAGQLATANYQLVGHCVNIIPIRSKLNASASFFTYLKESKKTFLDAYEHQQLSFGQLLKKLNFKRDPSRVPLVPVVFNIDMGMDNAVEFAGLSYRLISNPRTYETFELFLNATGSNDTLVLEWNYNTQLFKESTINKFSSDFEQLLQQFVANPDTKIEFGLGKELADVGADMQVPGNYSGKSLVAIINESAVLNAKRTAIQFKNEQITYQELYNKSNQFAHVLKHKGIGNGDIIGLTTDRSIEMLIALLGILKVGATYLSIDPSYPKDRIDFMLADADVKMLLLTKKYAHQFENPTQLLFLENVWTELNHHPSNYTDNVALHQISNLIYTSGTTGKPKGTKTSHKNLANLITSIKERPGILPDDKFLALTTISFDIAVAELFLPLTVGATVVIASEEEGKDGRLLLEIIEKEGITIVQATPSRWKMLLNSGWEKQYPITVFTAGEALSKQLAHQLLAKTKAVWNLYGPTETTIYSTIKKVTLADEMITIGKPVNNTAIYILDEHRNPLPNGSIGEIYIAGEGVAEGYLNRPVLSAEKFIPDRFSNVTQQRMYGTGDLGKYLPNGEIQCLGRKDHQVKIRGYRIELEEVEAALATQKEIKEVVVTTKTDSDDNLRLVVYVILEESEDEFNTHLAKENEGDEAYFINKKLTMKWKGALSSLLPTFMIPDQYIAVKSFALTPNGKIDRNKLTYPTQSLFDEQHSDALSINETIVANIWSKILKQKNLRPSDDFFELGGHSLLAVTVMMEIEKQTKKKLPLSSLFENSTIEGLAKLLNTHEQEIKWNSLVPIKKTGTKTPIYLIHGAGLNVLIFNPMSKYADEDQPVYGMQAIGLNEDKALNYSMEEIAEIYVSEILAHNPNGPYALAGYSLGGLLAFEMARQLIKMGKEIKMLGMLDTNATGNTIYRNKADALIKKFARQIHKPLFFAKSFVQYPYETIKYQLDGIYSRLAELLKIDNKLQDDLLLGKDELFKSYDTAYENYKLKPLDVHIDLFRVKKRLYFLDDLKYLGWGTYADRGVSVHEIPGDHKTFLSEPHVKAFATALQNALNEKN